MPSAAPLTISDRPPRILVLGSLNMDFVVHASRMPAAGESLSASSFQTALGGKGANQAVAAHRLGASVTLVGQVGADPSGDQLLQALAREGIDVAHVQRDDLTSTGAAFIVIEPTGQNRILVVPGANLTYTTQALELVQPLLASADMLVLQLEMSPEVVQRAVEMANASHVPVLLNPGPVPPGPLPRELLSKLRWITPNETEAEVLTGQPVVDVASARDAVMVLRRLGAESAVITLGDQGAVGIGADGEVFHAPSHPVTAEDTVAAGDTFTGGLAVRLCEGATLREAMSFATAAAAICVTRPGALASVPLRSEVEARLAEHQAVG